ncbi:MAG: carboxylating nicotinate-nucleotide diphosphorylase [Planctomycetota bacterium]|nr:carboxylating nicotinate-nucleotide diphosphorylase [Planctomycetota bacterium]
MSDDAVPALDLEDVLPLIDRALAEDHAREDVTSHAFVPADREGRAEVLARESGVLAGRPVVEAVFARLDPACRVEGEFHDSDRFGSGSVLFSVHGPVRSLLAGERTALNFLRHLTGVATLTAAFVERTMATGAKVYDTRKTTPGYRLMEKYAVRCGGGENHRMDLADAGMIKENHLQAAFGRKGPEAIAEAVRACKAALPEGKALYVEVESIEELEAAVEAGATVLMLDDFDLGDVRQAVRYIRTRPAPRPALEITGGVRLETMEALASAGASRISIGALTHSAPNVDLAMKIR